MGEQYRPVIYNLLGIVGIKNATNKLINCIHEKWNEGEKQML